MCCLGPSRRIKFLLIPVSGVGQELGSDWSNSSRVGCILGLKFAIAVFSASFEGIFRVSDKFLPATSQIINLITDY